MRKTISVLLIVLVGLMMFTACNPESKTTEELVNVSLLGKKRALSAEVNFSKDGLYWEYTAVKKDNGLATGATTEKTPLNADGTTALLSQGYWSFTLYGYNNSTDKNLVCQGSVDKVLITTENNKVSISVNPRQDAKGTILIKKDISISADDSTAYSGTEYKKCIAVFKVTDGVVAEDPLYTEDDVTEDKKYAEVDSGTYKVVVAFIGDYGLSTAYVAATGAKYINVYDYLTTTLSGLIKETAKAANLTVIDAIVAGYDAEGDYQAEAKVPADQFVKAEASSSATNSETITIAAPVSPAGKATTTSETDGSTTTVNDTVVTFPASSIVKSDDSDTAVSLNIATKSLISDGEGETKTASTDAGLAVYQISGANGAPAAALEFKLDGAKLDNSLSNSAAEKAPYGHTYIAKGLGDSFDKTDEDDTNNTETLTIAYLGGGDAEAENQKPELLAYDSETGKLTYRVYHFSTYVIFANKYVATDNNGGLYETLAEAVEKAADGATITLWKDAEIKDLSEPIGISKNLTINLNQKKLTVRNATTVATRDNAAAFNILENTKLEVRNGNIIGYNGTTFCLMKDGADLTLVDVTATLTNDVDNTPAYWKAEDGTWVVPKVVQIYQCVEPTLTIKNSTLTVEHGAYGIASNATVGANDEVAKMTVTIDTTTVETKCDDSTALLLNVPGTITITDSTIIGDRHGAILRGGTYTISDSSFEYKSNNDENKSKESANWGSGNAVPNAAIVIGNRGDGYKYPTTVTFSGTNTLTVPADSNQLYVYQADSIDGKDRTVRVIGDINGDWTVNEDINGAEYPLAKIGDKYYSTLHSAVLAAQTGETVTLLCDASGSGLESKDASGNAVGARGDITIDFDGHTYTVTNTSVGSTGTETQAMHWGRSIKSITMKNGKFTTTQFDTLKMGMQNYVDFTAENMTFDMSNVLVVKFGENEFSGNNAIYNGKEVAIFNNNKGAMKLKKCTVTLPESSKMGMSADGDSVTLVETTVNGAVNMQDSTSKLIKDSSSKITKGVVAYFSETYDISETTTDGSTTYTLAAKSTT